MMGTPQTCPGCGSGHTMPVVAAGQRNMLCTTCGTCWHLTGAAPVRVHSEVCPGCPQRAICQAAYG